MLKYLFYINLINKFFVKSDWSKTKNKVRQKIHLVPYKYLKRIYIIQWFIRYWIIARIFTNYSIIIYLEHMFYVVKAQRLYIIFLFNFINFKLFWCIYYYYTYTFFNYINLLDYKDEKLNWILIYQITLANLYIILHE